MSCHACQKTPSDYLAQKEWFHESEKRLLYTKNLISKKNSSKCGILRQSGATTIVLKEKLPREHGVIPDLLRMIRNMLPSSELDDLHLENNNITDTKLIKLAEMLPSSKLNRLMLNNNQIGDAGAIALMEALSNSNISYLKLQNNQITDTEKKRIKIIQIKEKNCSDRYIRRGYIDIQLSGRWYDVL